MELIILLVVLALLAAVLMGPIALAKANAVARSAEAREAKLKNRLDQLAAQLTQVQLRLCAIEDGPDTSEVDTPEAAEPVADQAHQATAIEQAPKATEWQAEPPAEPEAEPVEDEQPLSMLEALRVARERVDAQLDTNRETHGETVSDEQAQADLESAAQPEPVNEEQSDPIEPNDPIESNHHTVHEPATAATARRLTIEEVLAGKVFVWIGAIALVLTGAFLLKIGFAEGIITPQLCVISAGVLGLAMWGVGEWMYKRVSLISQALCGAAVAVLYGTIIAADHYMLLGSGFGVLGTDLGVAFGLMAVVTTAAVVLSLRHGPAVAILGMLGGFMLPPLLVDNTSPTLGMVLYLIAIEVGVLAVTGKRGWFGISLITLVFSMLWSIGYTLIGDNAHERTLTAMLVLGTAGAYLFHTARIHRDPAAAPGTRKRVLGLSIAATCSAIGIVALLAIRGDYALRDLGMLWLVAAGTLVLARIDARQLAMPFVAMGLSLLVLFSDALQSLPGPPSDTLITMSACFGGLFALGGYVCMWGSPHRRVFAIMSAIAGPGFYGLVVLAGHEALGLRENWWPYTLGLAGLYALAVVPMLLRRNAEHDWPIALFSVLSFALVCVSLGQALDHPRFAVCLALVSAVAALIDLRLFIRPLRLAGCVTAFGAAALLVVPGPFDLTIHGGPVFNTLLPMYALPALAFGIIAWAAARSGSRKTAQNLTWLCMATLTGMLLVLTRDIFQPVDFNAEAFQLYEWSTCATVFLLAGFAAHWVGRRFSYEPIEQATRFIVGLGAALGLIGGLVPSNPLFQDDTIGGLSLVAGLFALYAAPAALLWLWSRRPMIREVPQLAESLRAVSITLLAFFVALQIRNGFTGGELQGSSFDMFECVTYAVAWILLGGFMQWYNQRQLQSRATRIAGRVLFAMGLMTTVVGSVVVFNPLLTTDATGGWGLAARMLVLYALPAALLWAWSRGKTLADQPVMVSALRGTSIALLALFVGLQIRNGFQSDNLQVQSVGLYECVTYMVAAMLLGGFIQRLNQQYLRDTVTRIAGQTIFVIGLATTLAGGIFVYNPIVDQTAEGGWGLAGRMAVLYLLPGGLMWLWSRGRTLADQATLINILRGTAIAYLALYVGLMVRNAFQTDDLRALTTGLFECTTYGLVWAALGYLLHRIAPRCKLPQTTGTTGRAVFYIGLGALILGNVLLLNPLWYRETVGSMPVLNGLWYVYGPLILILALLARKARQLERVMPAKLAGFMAVGLSFMLLSMFVRHGFSGDGYVIIDSNLEAAERYAYSLAWVLFGGVLLVAGVFTRLDTLRYGSLAVLLLAVGKVFLIDTANLENLYRVFSFFGLGVTLVGLGYLYQRLVFRRPSPFRKGLPT